jgi:hypothetical protein
MGLVNKLGQMLGDATKGNLDLEKLSKSSPQDLTQGIMQAFRSDQTPPFGEMASQLFSKADPQQKSGLLNTILGAIGPNALGQLGADQGGLRNILNSLQTGRVSPEQAEQVSPQEFGRLADQAEKQNPTVIERISQFVSQNPGMLKSLGGTAVALVTSKFTGK